MKIGDYVRTKSYGIAKILNTYNNTTTNYSSITLDIIDCFGRLGVSVGNNEIIKSSPNIIDLIEVGDFVNGKLVTSAEDVYTTDNIYIGKEVFVNHEELIIEEDIENVVTKEQFESMQYNLESEVK